MRIVCRRQYHRLQRPHSPPTAPMMLRTDCQVCQEPLIEASLPASLLVLSLRGVVSGTGARIRIVCLHGREEKEADRDGHRLGWLFHRFHRSDCSSPKPAAAIELAGVQLIAYYSDENERADPP